MSEQSELKAGSQPSCYAALRRSERYPELKHVDADLLDEWRNQRGLDPDGWDVRAVLETQLARNIRELTESIRRLETRKQAVPCTFCKGTGDDPEPSKYGNCRCCHGSGYTIAELP